MFQISGLFLLGLEVDGNLNTTRGCALNMKSISIVYNTVLIGYASPVFMLTGLNASGKKNLPPLFLCSNYNNTFKS